MKLFKSEESKKEFLAMIDKRSKALLWAMGAMVASAAVDTASAAVGLFDLPSWLVVGIGLLLAQITKELNK